MLIPKSDESFPFCPPFFSEGWNEQGFTLEFIFEKGRGGDRKREKRGSEERHRNIGGGGDKKNTGYKERGEEGEKQEKSREPCERSKKQSENGGTLENAACACGGN